MNPFAIYAILCLLAAFRAAVRRSPFRRNW